MHRSTDIVFWPWFAGKQRNCNLATEEIRLSSIASKPVEKVQHFALFPSHCHIGYNCDAQAVAILASLRSNSTFLGKQGKPYAIGI